MSTNATDGGPAVYPWVTRETRIEECGLSTRVLNVLMGAGINTVGDAINLSRLQFLTLKNGGEGGWSELRAFSMAFLRHEEGQGQLVGCARPVNVALRDYFAASALQGMLASGERGAPKQDAQDAYEYADAMLRAREAKSDG